MPVLVHATLVAETAPRPETGRRSGLPQIAWASGGGRGEPLADAVYASRIHHLPATTEIRTPIVKRLNHLGLLLVFMLAASGAAFANAAPGPVLTTLLTKELHDLQGKEMLAITVEYPPGGADPGHRHDAHVFVYVLEGSVVMGLRGGREVTLTKGQTFYEGPQDVHTVSRNASSTKSAKFLVVFFKEKGVDSVIPTR